MTHDPSSGQLLTGSLWSYATPLAWTIPKLLNVELVPVRQSAALVWVLCASSCVLATACQRRQGAASASCAVQPLPTAHLPTQHPQESHLDRGILGSKAVGEPPLLLCASAVSAFQLAEREAAREHKTECSMAALPLTMQSLAAAAGPGDVASALRRRAAD